MPRKIRDFALAALGIVLLLAALAVIDDRVPGQVAGVARDVAAGEWQLPAPAADMVAAVAGSPAADNIFVFALLAAALILVILMLRT
jgi:hypothetical protein